MSGPLQVCCLERLTQISLIEIDHESLILQDKIIKNVSLINCFHFVLKFAAKYKIQNLFCFQGDIAILIASGMTMKRALFLNFLSACVCCLGLVTGTILGETTDANRWILAVAGGVFLYVPLVDMVTALREMTSVRLTSFILNVTSCVNVMTCNTI